MIDQLATVDEAGTRVTLALVNRDPATAVGLRRPPRRSRARPGRSRAPCSTARPPTRSTTSSSPARWSRRRTTVRFEDGRTTLPPHSLTVVHIDLPLAFAAGEVGVARPTDAPWHATERGWFRTTTG